MPHRDYVKMRLLRNREVDALHQCYGKKTYCFPVYFLKNDNKEMFSKIISVFKPKSVCFLNKVLKITYFEIIFFDREDN